MQDYMWLRLVPPWLIYRRVHKQLLTSCTVTSASRAENYSYELGWQYIHSKHCSQVCGLHINVGKLQQICSSSVDTSHTDIQVGSIQVSNCKE